MVVDAQPVRLAMSKPKLKNAIRASKVSVLVMASSRMRMANRNPVRMGSKENKVNRVNKASSLAKVRAKAKVSNRASNRSRDKGRVREKARDSSRDNKSKRARAKGKVNNLERTDNKASREKAKGKGKFSNRANRVNLRASLSN